MIAMPKRCNVNTVRDYKILPDCLTELRYPSRHRLATLLAWVHEKFALDQVIDRHIAVQRRLTAGGT